MSKLTLHCAIVEPNPTRLSLLMSALQATKTPVRCTPVASLADLTESLNSQSLDAVFCVKPHDERVQPKLLAFLQRYSAQTLLVWLSDTHWQGLTRWLAGVESCTVSMADAEHLQQQLDFLLSYLVVKREFRACKHLLKVAETRSHWLADYSWEAIAYIDHHQHLYANHAYLSLFGFRDLESAQSTPVLNLVDEADQAAFTHLHKTIYHSTKPSSRLLITLQSVTKQPVRAEIRFIPAVLNGQRCSQLHVAPTERTAFTVASRLYAGPWQQPARTAQQSPLAIPETLTFSAPTKPLDAHLPLEGIHAVYSKVFRLGLNIPNVYFAEARFQSSTGLHADYAELMQKLTSRLGRYRLDYWTIASAIEKLANEANAPTDYLIFVSLGDAIFNNENLLKDVVQLLKTSSFASKRLVLGVRYQDCKEQFGGLGKVLKALRTTSIKLAIDELPYDTAALKLIAKLKPFSVRMHPDMAQQLTHSAADALAIQQYLQQLQSQVFVVVSGVDTSVVLNLLKTTPVSYLQGALFSGKKA